MTRQSKEEIAAKQKAYNAAHRKEITDRARAYEKLHREKRNAQRRERNVGNPKESARKRAYEVAHRAEIAARKRAYEVAHRAEIAERKKAWRAVRRAELAAYKVAHRDETTADWHNRNAKKHGCEGTHTAAEWRALSAWFGNVCLCCGTQDDLTRDHVVPITSGGSNWVSNLQPLCRRCNTKKQVKTIDYRDPVLLTQFLASHTKL